MKNLILLFLILFSTAGLTQPVEGLFNKNVKVIRDSSKVYLVGQDCKLLNKEGEALAKWTKSVDERAQDKSCSCKGGECRKEVSTMLPDFAEAYQFKHLPTDGPNCWNATLVAAKVVPQIRYTSDLEMNFWMNSPLCKERKAGEALAPGDIIAIRDTQQGEVHGFVHLSDNLSFSKNGYNKDSPYSLQDPNVVFDIYGVTPSCRRKTGHTRDCQTYANYYSCKSMDEYLREKPIRDRETRAAYEQLDDLECQISVSVISGGNGGTLKSLVAVSLQALHSLAFKTIKEKKYQEEDKIIWQAIYHKTKSLAEQVVMME